MVDIHIHDDSDGVSDTMPWSAARGLVTIFLDKDGLAVMDQDEDLKDWNSLPDDAIIHLKKIDLDTIYISIIQVSLALLAGDAEL